MGGIIVQYIVHNNTGQQNLTFFFVPRGNISNPDSTFNAEFKYVSSFSSSPTVLLWQQVKCEKMYIYIFHWTTKFNFFFWHTEANICS
jgi:hypothetical protein